MTRATVALTGATGFIGHHLVRRLRAAGHRVRALARDPSRLSDLDPPLPPADLVKGSLDDEAALARLVKGAEAVIHCAGVVKARSRQGFFAANHEGAERVVRHARDAGVGRLVLISSLAARHPALNAYTASKAAAEASLREQAGAMDWAIVRPPAVYGPGDRETSKIIRIARAGFLPTVAPSAARFSVIHVDDLAGWIVTMLAEAPLGRIAVEPDDGKVGGYSWDEFAAALSAALHRRVRVLRLPRGIAAGVAAVNQSLALLAGMTPMVTLGKLREFAHPDWISDSATHATPFLTIARRSLAAGLAETLAAAAGKRLEPLE